MKIFVICLLIMFCSMSVAHSQTLNRLRKKAIGYWEIPTKERAVRKGNEILSPGISFFYYDGENVTLLLYTLKAWMWKSDDDYYKVKTRWSHDSLFYLPPFGRWTYLARFDGDNFFCEEQNQKWKFVKLQKEQVNKTDSAILKERKLHDYNIKPTDKCKTE